MKIARTKNTIRNAGWGIASKCITGVFPVIMRSVIVSYIGTEYLGLSTLFSSIISVLSLADLGLPGAIVFSMYKPIAEDDRKTICALMAFYKRAYSAIGMIIAAVGLAIMPFLTLLIKGEYPTDINIYYLYLIYLLNTVIGYFLFAYKNCLLTAHQRNDVNTKITMVTTSIQYLICIPALIFTKNYYLYAVSAPLISIVNNLVTAYYATKLYPNYITKGKLEKNQINDIKKRVGGLMLSRVSSVTRNTFDSIFISAFLGLKYVTMYGNYFYLMSTVVVVLSIITSGMSAGIGNSIAVESLEKNYADLQKFTFIFAWISGWCAICLICLYQPAMQLWMGTELMLPDYMVLLFGAYFYALQAFSITDQYYNAAGLWWVGKWRTISETVANLLLNYVLGKCFGLVGIVLATVITAVLINFGYGTHILFKYYFKGYDLVAFIKAHMKYLVGIIVAGMITYLTCLLFRFDAKGMLLVRGVICIVVPNVFFAIVYRKNDHFDEMKALLRVFINTVKK